MNVNCKFLQEFGNLFCFRCEEDIISVTRISDLERISYSEDPSGFPIYRSSMIEEK